MQVGKEEMTGVGSALAVTPEEEIPVAALERHEGCSAQNTPIFIGNAIQCHFQSVRELQVACQVCRRS